MGQDCPGKDPGTLGCNENVILDRHIFVRRHERSPQVVLAVAVLLHKLLPSKRVGS